MKRIEEDTDWLVEPDIERNDPASGKRAADKTNVRYD
jgi:hypothetical protein